MSKYSKLNSLFCLFAVPILLNCGCDGPKPMPETEHDDAVTNENILKNYTEQLKALYENAKEAGEQIPENIIDWANADVKKIGTWDYKVVSFSTESEKLIVDELNRLGRERWECFWVESIPGGKRFYMKKAVRSYLQLTGKASKFIPVPGSGE